MKELLVVQQNSSICRGDSMWCSYGLCKLARAVTLFTVPPMLSHGDFQWEAAKKFHTAVNP